MHRLPHLLAFLVMTTYMIPTTAFQTGLAISPRLSTIALCMESDHSALYHGVIVLKICLDKGRESVAVQKGVSMQTLAPQLAQPMSHSLPLQHPEEPLPYIYTPHSPLNQPVEYASSGYHPRRRFHGEGEYAFSQYKPNPN